MIVGTCEKCNTWGPVERHHKLSQSKLNRRLYGDLLENPINIQYLCPGCHKNRPVDKLSEIEFCNLLNIVPRSRTGLKIWERLKLLNQCKGIIEIIKNA
jgi:hypothetical protein